MTGGISGYGTAGTKNSGGYDYPGVPYSSNDFNHPICTIQNYNDANEVKTTTTIHINNKKTIFCLHI